MIINNSSLSLCVHLYMCVCVCVLCDRKNNLFLTAQGLILMLYTTSETNFYFPSIPSASKNKQQQQQANIL